MRSAVLGVAISTLFLYLTLRQVDVRRLGEALAAVSIPILSLALLTRGAAFVALAARSWATTAPAGRASLKTLALSHLLGYTGNNVLPLRMGELLRIDYLARRAGFTRAFLLGTVGAERLLDVVVLLALFALTVPTVLTGGLADGSFALLAAGAGMALFLTLLLVRWTGLPRLVENLLKPLDARVGRFVGRTIERGTVGLSALLHLRHGPSALAATVAYWLCGMGSVAIVIAAFGLDLPWYAPALVIAVTALGTALPSSPAFVGTYHYFSALGVTLLGVDPTTAASFAVVVHAVAFVPFTLVGIIIFAPTIRSWNRPADVGSDASAQESLEGEQATGAAPPRSVSERSAGPWTE